jgi:hypothetical protein
MHPKGAISFAIDGVICCALAYACASAADETPRGLYEVTTQTTMPHLEENLRYADTRQQRCLAQDELWTAFPVLDHPALKGCRLTREYRAHDARSYALVCEDGSGTTGRATWRVGTHQMTGALSVKLGGKNMTFSQRLVARRLADCDR